MVTTEALWALLIIPTVLAFGAQQRVRDVFARYRKIERDAARAVRKELQALKADIGRSRKS